MAKTKLTKLEKTYRAASDAELTTILIQEFNAQEQNAYVYRNYPVAVKVAHERGWVVENGERV